MDQLFLEILKTSGPQSISIVFGLIILARVMKSDKNEIKEEIKQLRETLNEQKEISKAHTKALQDLIISTTRLDIRSEDFIRLIGKTEKMEKDLNELFGRVRQSEHRDN
jgi:ABC-type transporter Mla subunit MlaD